MTLRRDPAQDHVTADGRPVRRCRWAAVAAGVLLSLGIAAQPFLVTGGSDNTCAGAFLDSGGQGATGYTNNEDDTYTLCPDVPGSLISLSFVTFNLSLAGVAPVDNLTIYDGPNTAAPLLGSFTGTSLQGQTISASTGNASGCLTFVWHSNNTGTGVFAASIHCFQPCTPPVAAATMTQAAPARVCMGTSVNFDGSGSTAQPGYNLVSWTWDFDDGTTTTSAVPTIAHTFTDPGVHTVQLTVTDNNGCASVNRIDLQVWVGTPPTFTGTGGSTTGCAGEQLCLDGVVNPTPYVDEPETTYGNGVFVPDDVGSCFEAQLYLTQFAPGATLTNINQLLGLCMNIEHSWLGDLVITITSPSGQSVILHQQGIIQETLLGQPVDPDEANPQPGTCAQYCFANTSSNGTMAAYANANGSGFGWELPPGTYQSLSPLTGLVGSQLNGLWTLTICDMWQLDNGFLCDWNIDLDPSLYANAISYTPQYGAGCDSTWWTGPGIVSTGPGCEQICLQQAAAGTYNYVYHAVDDFGCSYDTTIVVTITPPIVVDAGANTSICEGGSTLLNGSVISGGLPPQPCTYQLDLLDSFGDGWDGAVIGIVINGVEQDWTLPNGSSGSVTINVEHGDAIALIYYPSVLFNNEHAYNLYDGQGNLVFADTPPFPNGTTWSGVVDCGPPPAFIYSWSPATGLSATNIAAPTATPGTTTTYTLTVSQAGHPACTGTDQVTVTVVPPVNAGTDAQITVCANSAPFDLFALLGGAPMTGGTWTGPGGATAGSTFTPGTSAPGTYTYSVNGAAPCPGVDQATVTVTVNQPVDAGTDATLTVCANDATAALLPLLGGAQAGGAWTDPGGAPTYGTFTPGTSTPGVYTYTLTGAAPCPNDQATVTITENQPVDAGTDATLTVCANDATAALLPLLGGAQAGGAWTDPGGAPSNGNFTPGTSTPGVYTYTLTGTAPCPNDQATVTITENQPVDAGTDATLTVCANDATAALIPLLVGAQAGGAWTDPGGAPSNGTFTPGTSAPGVYTYTLTGTAPCPNDQATVTVTENQPVDAGTDATLTVCANDATAALLPLLGGAQAGGTWTDPGGAPSNGTFSPGTSTPGVYTYTLTGTAPCPNDQATVTIAENQPVDAGADGSITLCSSGTPVDLFASLGGAQPGGSWSFNGSPHGNSFDPSVDAGGQYTYVVTGTAPCPNDQAEVIVSVNQQPDAGADGATILCISSPSIDLFAELGGAPEAGGTWTFGGATHGNVFTPGSDLPGTYIYTVTGAAPCPTDQATVDVTVTAQPDPGTNGTTTVCASDGTFDLFTVLGGTPDLGGTWSANGAPHGNTFVPGTDAPGVYTYTITVPPPCANVSATVTVDVVQPPDAGTDGDALLCISGPALDLFAELSGAQAGGSWSLNGAPHGNLFTPGLDAAGAYIYTIPGIAPCPNDQSAVTVAVTNDPDPGMNSSITLCANAAAIDLFANLGGTPDPGGSWSFNGAPHTGTFDPATEAAGVYTYTVDVPPPCTSQSATVTVMVVQPANAGADGDALLCVSGSPLPLFGELSGAQTGGTWTFNGAPHGGTFDPGTDAAGVYTYTVAGVTPCPDDQSNVTVAVTTDPDPGTDGSITLCASDAAADLFTALGGTPDAGGSWSFNGAPHSGQVDPTVDAAGVYTYTVNAPPPCTSQSATVTVNIVQPPDAGADGDALLCISSPPIDLFTVLAGADAGGSWSFNGVPHGNTFSPGTDATGAYTYTVAGIAPCPADQSLVTVSVTNNPEPGTNGALVVCASGDPIDLFAQLGGTPDAGGTWSVNGTPHGGMFDPAIDAAGVYTYTITVPPPCTNASSTVTVLVQAPPEAGQDGALTVCTTSPTATLIDALTGAQPGGNWTFAGAPHAGSFAPGSDAPGNYSYTVTGTAPCPDDQATVVVTVNAPPDAGEDGTLSVCSTDDPMDLFALLGGTPDAGGTWSVGGASHSASYDPDNDAPGIYTYTLSGTAPCPGDAATVTVSELAPPDAGLDGTLSACAAGSGIDLFAELGGTPDAGGTWSGPSAVSNGQFDPGTMQPGIYTYLVTGTAPCANDAAQVNVSVTSPPDPGGDGALLLCTGSPAVDLFAQLSGTPDPGGAWTYNGAPHNGSFDPSVDANGIYTYTVSGTAPCPSASATVTMTVTSTPDAGLPGNATLCSSAAALPLLGLLGGTPDAGGVWTDPNGAAHGALFDPANDPPGTYTYAINVPPPCVSTSSTVTIALVEPADPGSGGSVDLCTTSAVVDLDALLGGSPDPDGEWSFNGIPHGDQVDPAIDASGIYTYTVAGTAPCPSVDAEVLVTIHAPPDAGGNGSVTLCASSPALDLFAELAGSPQSGGSWTFNGAPHGALFDPAVDLSGTLTYTVPGIAPCPADTSTVLVNVVSAPDPGTDGSVTLCANSSAVVLFDQLGGTPDNGGTWSGPSPVVGGLFQPGSMAPGTYTYTIDVPAPCTSVQSQVVVAVQSMPDAGSDGSAVLCASAAASDLFTVLGGAPQPGGSWTGPDGQPHTSLFNPATDLPGAYTYTVAGTWPCPSASAQVLMAVTAEPDPGWNGAASLCADGSAIDLFAQLGGTPDVGGSWTGPSVVQGGVFDPATMQPGLYTYTLSVPPPCQSASSQVLISVVQPPDPGTDGATVLCSTDGVMDLFAWLGGTPDPGGSWSFNGLTHSANFDPAVDPSGAYTYMVHGTPPCAAATATVVTEVVLPPDAGADNTLTLCPDGAPVDLFTALGGSPDAGGTWSAPGGAAMGGLFDPAVDQPGTYTYMVNATAPCANDQAAVVVSVPPAIQATTTVTDAVCHGSCDGSASLQVSGGTPDYTFQWSGGVAGQTDVSATGLCAGAYDVIITDAFGCKGFVELTIGQPPPLVIDAVLATDELCPGQCDGTATVVDTEGVLFSADGGLTWQGTPAFAGLCAGSYMLMMQDANGCLASATASVASPPPVIASFTAVEDTVITGITSVDFMNQSAFATSFFWDFAGLGASTEGEPSFTFPDVLDGTYTVCLTAMNANGCVDTTCHPVVVLGELIVHVPNAFTPNDDGMNEGFRPVFNNPQNVADYDLLVFDRWGELIFESRRVGETWDGRMSGELVKEDVYAWKLHFRDLITRKKHDLIGHVTLLK
ncbi:MAG: PKD domain-containing protein [Flavobacteriales bacterium]